MFRGLAAGGRRIRTLGPPFSTPICSMLWHSVLRGWLMFPMNSFAAMPGVKAAFRVEHDSSLERGKSIDH